MPAALKDLFTAVVRTASRTQSRLDDRIPHRPACAYSLQNVSVKARFGATQVHGKIFFWFGHASRQDLEHTLRFKALAAQSAGEAPPTEAGQFSVRAPAFLVPPAERQSIVEELKRYLAAAGRQFAAESDWIAKALESGKDDPGLTMLRLARGRTLIVRLGGDKDGIFLRDESAAQLYTAVSYMGADETTLAWAPFHELFEVLRGWQREQFPLVPIGGVVPPARLGSIEVARFSRELSEAALAATEEMRGEVATAGAASIKTAYPIHYSLQDVTADLAYSVARGTNDEQAAMTPLIRSVARVRAAEGGSPEVSLLSPEYVLTGTQRAAFFELFDAFLELGDEDSDGLWRHLDREYLAAYQRALADAQRRRDTLVLLSYRGKTPLNQFLVVSTGAIKSAGEEGEEREFAFRVRLDGKRLIYAGMVLALEEPIDPGSISSDQQPFRAAQVLYDAAHPGLHDFFHASWIWDLAGDWYEGR